MTESSRTHIYTYLLPPVAQKHPSVLRRVMNVKTTSSGELAKTQGSHRYKAQTTRRSNRLEGMCPRLKPKMSTQSESKLDFGFDFMMTGALNHHCSDHCSFRLGCIYPIKENVRPFIDSLWMVSYR